LEFVPIRIDRRAEPLVKLDAALIPLGDVPFDHAAIGLLSLSRDSFHQEFTDTPASVPIGDIEFLNDKIRLRSISERDKIINEESNQLAAFFGDETVKIGWRTVESLLAQHVFGYSEVVGVFFKLRQLAHQRKQIGNIALNCFPDSHIEILAGAGTYNDGINLPKRISSGD